MKTRSCWQLRTSLHHRGSESYGIENSSYNLVRGCTRVDGRMRGFARWCNPARAGGEAREVLSGESEAHPSRNQTVTSKTDALHLIPEQAKAVLMRDHHALREFGVPFLLNPGSGFDGRMGGNFSEKEVELSAIALLAKSEERGDLNFVACLQLAPGTTVQRLANAWKLEQDNKGYPGFVCYRNVTEQDGSYFVAQRGSVVAIGKESQLKPRLTSAALPGAIEKRLLPVAADYDLIACCLADYHDLSVAEGYLQPLLDALAPRLGEFEKLPPGVFSSITLALRVGTNRSCWCEWRPPMPHSQRR